MVEIEWCHGLLSLRIRRVMLYICYRYIIITKPNKLSQNSFFLMFYNPVNSTISSHYTEESREFYETAKAKLQADELNPIKEISWGKNGDERWIKIIIDFHGINRMTKHTWKRDSDSSKAKKFEPIWRMLMRSKTSSINAKQTARGRSPLMWGTWWE